jgi:hypothetical protein
MIADFMLESVRTLVSQAFFSLGFYGSQNVQRKNPGTASSVELASCKHRSSAAWLP